METSLDGVHRLRSYCYCYWSDTLEKTRTHKRYIEAQGLIGLVNQTSGMFPIILSEICFKGHFDFLLSTD